MRRLMASEPRRRVKALYHAAMRSLRNPRRGWWEFGICFGEEGWVAGVVGRAPHPCRVPCCLQPSVEVVPNNGEKRGRGGGRGVGDDAVVVLLGGDCSD